MDRLFWLQLLPQSLRCSLVTDLNRSAPRSRLVLRNNPPRHPFPPISLVPAERAEAMVPRSSHPRRTFRRLILQSYAAFLQNASVWCVAYPGFHPGLVCRAPLGHSEHPLNYPTWHNAGGSGTLAVARLGGEHHTHLRAALKPILPRAYSARGGHGPAEPAPETHLWKACPTLAVARLGGEHHNHSRAARKPILPRAF